MNKIKLSIIVPVYNSLLYLPKCVQSMIVAQDKVRDKLEIILIDDGSNDGTEELVDLLASKYDFIKVVHEKGSGGPATPRNIGLSIANGEYVYFCDNDDYFAPHALEKMLEHADEWKPDVMACRLGYDGSRKNIGTSMFKENNPDVDIYRTTISRTLGPWKLYNRNFLIDNDFQFPTDCPDDNPFVLRAYLLAKRVSVAADQEYYFWTKKADESNLSSQASSKWYGYERIYKCAKSILEIYRDHADLNLGKIYMLPRIIKWPVEAYQGILFGNKKIDKKNNEYIEVLRKLLSEVLDEDFLLNSVTLEEYVVLSTLLNESDNVKAKKILEDFQNKKWKEVKNEKSLYELANGLFKIDSRYFIEPDIKIDDIKYEDDKMHIKAKIFTNNFSPKSIDGAKIILKKHNSKESFEYDLPQIYKINNNEYNLDTIIDLNEFFKFIKKSKLNNSCSRFDIWLNIIGNREIRLSAKNGEEIFTKFSNYLNCDGKHALIPHLSDGSVMCFWYIGKKSNSFSKEFFKIRTNRSLLNDLSVQMVKNIDFKSLFDLSNDNHHGRMNIKLIADKVIKYNKKEYKVGYFAYIEAKGYIKKMLKLF